MFNGEVTKSSPVIDGKVYLRIFHLIKEFIVRISLVKELLELIYQPIFDTCFKNEKQPNLRFSKDKLNSPYNEIGSWNVIGGKTNFKLIGLRPKKCKCYLSLL